MSGEVVVSLRTREEGSQRVVGYTVCNIVWIRGFTGVGSESRSCTYATVLSPLLCYSYNLLCKFPVLYFLVEFIVMFVLFDNDIRLRFPNKRQKCFWSPPFFFCRNVVSPCPKTICMSSWWTVTSTCLGLRSVGYSRTFDVIFYFLLLNKTYHLFLKDPLLQPSPHLNLMCLCILEPWPSLQVPDVVDKVSSPCLI